MKIRYVGPLGGEMCFVDRSTQREYETVNREVEVPDELGAQFTTQAVWVSAEPATSESTSDPEPFATGGVVQRSRTRKVGN